MQEDNTRQRIIDKTIETVQKQGIRFSMDDLASELTMSKKTIYAIFSDKEELLIACIDSVFDAIKKAEQKITDDPSLSTKEKLQGILGVLPDSYRNIDFRGVMNLESKYPGAYQKAKERIETGWDSTFSLINQGIREGIFRHVDPVIFQMTYEAAVEHFLQEPTLKLNEISYEKALQSLADLMVNGLNTERKD